MSKITTIFFDCFGVIAGDGWAAIEARVKITPQLRKEVHSLGKQYDLSMIKPDDFYRQASALLNLPIEEFIDLFTNLHKNKQLLDLVKDLKKNYKIGMISNVNKTFMQEFLTPSESDLFDDMVLSGEVNIVKPDRRIYLLAAERLDVETSACLMVDDRQINCDGAVATGMQAILYTSFNDFKPKLKQVLADSNN